MKIREKELACALRSKGYSINAIAEQIGVAKSTVSVWVRTVELPEDIVRTLNNQPYTNDAIEKRRLSRLLNEAQKRQKIIDDARAEISNISPRELWLVGVMLYWAEGGKTQRMFRFSNGDPQMIMIMMRFLRKICHVPEEKLRGHIHIHPHLDFLKAEEYWSSVSGIPRAQFFKTYQKLNKSSKSTGKDTLPNGVFDVYVMDTTLFLKVSGWAQGIFGAEIK